LATNLLNLYLFKLPSSAICSVIYGLNTNRTEVNMTDCYARKTGYFEIWETTLNQSFYTLDLNELPESRT